MPVHVVVEARGRKVTGSAVTERVVSLRANRMLAALQLKKAELSILLTGDRQIQKLNKIYRKKDRPTDVLAFAMQEGEFGSISHTGLAPILGDLIISVPTALRQAEERNVPLLDEITMLLGHGLLHLLGWDHDTDAKDRAMRKETERLIAAARGQRPMAQSVKDGKKKR